MLKLISIISFICITTSFEKAEPNCDLGIGHKYGPSDICIEFCQEKTKFLDNDEEEKYLGCEKSGTTMGDSMSTCLAFKKEDSVDNKTDFDLLCFYNVGQVESWVMYAQMLLLPYGYSKWADANSDHGEDDAWNVLEVRRVLV